MTGIPSIFRKPEPEENPYYAVVDGEAYVSAAGMALLLGVERADFLVEVTRQRVLFPDAAFVVPAAWARQGRRIAKETQAATGSTAMRDAIDFLATRARN